jgi:hypothetical protein
MFRLTIDGPQAAAFRAARPGAPLVTMRVYKWEDKVGFYLPGGKWDSAWIAEQRSTLAHGHGYLLEKVNPLTLEAPPPTVDDIWSEDVIVHGNSIAGNCLTIVGNAKTILDYVGRAGIKLDVELLTSPLPLEPVQAPPQPGAATSTPGTRPEGLLPPPASAGPKSLPPRQPPPHLRSSHAPSIHPAPHGPRMEEHRRPIHGPPYAPRPAHTGPRPYVRPAGPAPISRDRFHSRPAPQQPGPAHGAEGRHHYAQHRTGRLPPSQGCLVVAEE